MVCRKYSAICARQHPHPHQWDAMLHRRGLVQGLAPSPPGCSPHQPTSPPAHWHPQLPGLLAARLAALSQVFSWFSFRRVSTTHRCSSPSPVSPNPFRSVQSQTVLPMPRARAVPSVRSRAAGARPLSTRSRLASGSLFPGWPGGPGWRGCPLGNMISSDQTAPGALCSKAKLLGFSLISSRPSQTWWPTGRVVKRGRWVDWGQGKEEGAGDQVRRRKSLFDDVHGCYGG